MSSSSLTRCLLALVLVTGGVACGGNSFVAEGSGGNGGVASGGSSGKSATGGTGDSGGVGGSTGGSGGAGGSGGSGGSGGGAGSGSGGSSGGAGGVGGSLSGAGGDSGAAGAAGSCGPCLFIACGPPFMVNVSAVNGGAIADLEAQGDFEVMCYPNGATPCQWSCQSVDYQLASGDHSITLSAPGFEDHTISFSVPDPGSCGCCGCPCSVGYYGEEVLAGDGGATCCADLDADPLNCGECGHSCNGSTCTAGKCDGATDCSLLETQEACDASAECHSVFVDPGNCGCGGVGCCARFSRCADGDLADCSGANIGCTIETPFCEEPAYVVSYADACYEGCVVPTDCAP